MKKFTIVLLSSLLVLSCGCSKSNDAKEKEEKQEEKQEVNHSSNHTIKAVEETAADNGIELVDNGQTEAESPLILDQSYSCNDFDMQVLIYSTSKEASKAFKDELFMPLKSLQFNDENIHTSENKVYAIDSDYSEFYIYEIKDNVIIGISQAYVNDYQEALNQDDSFLQKCLNALG